MAKLKAAQRNKLKKQQFALQGARKYPIHDRAHAANAKARASQQRKKGNLSESQFKTILAKANAKLHSKKK